MSASETTYEAPIYEAPRIVKNVGVLLRAPRSYYATNFANAFSPIEEDENEYKGGLVAVLITILVLFICWALVLCYFKFQGKQAGCASGQAFRSRRVDDVDGIPSTDESESYSSFERSSSDASSEGDSSVEEVAAQHRNLYGSSSSGADEIFRQEESDIVTKSFDSSPDHTLDSNRVAQMRVNRREQRTRFCFLLFALVALMCVPLTLVFSFGPIRVAAQATDDTVLAGREIIDEVEVSLSSIESALASATDILKETELNIYIICPKIDRGVDPAIGEDLRELVNAVSDDYNAIVESSQVEADFVKDLVAGFGKGLTTFETEVEEVEGLLFLVPAALVGVGMLTTFAMLGTILAWRGKSGKQLQNSMSYVLLPALMILIVMCWFLVLVSALGAMIGTDMCTASSTSGTPDDTVQQILALNNLSAANTTYGFIEAYTNGCQGPSPTDALEEVQRDIQSNLDTIWRMISKIDSIGRSLIIEQCESTELTTLLSAARNLAKLLTAARRSVDSAATSLECERMNTIYTVGAHDTLCTDAISAVSYGFIFFLLLTICLMTMVSLRASWLQNIEEEKVYHDEHDVAENMILDEHEEYLAYISRYKHEWQEYRGFDKQQMLQRSYSEEDDDNDEYDGPENEFYEEGYNGADETSMVGSEEDSRSESDSKYSEEEISFAKFDNEYATSTQKSFSPREDDFFNLSQPLSQPKRAPPPPSNPEYNRPNVVQEESAGVAPSNVEQETKPAAAAKKESVGLDTHILSFFERYGINPGASVRRASPRSPPISPHRPPIRSPPASRPIVQDPPAQTFALSRPRSRYDETYPKDLEEPVAFPRHRTSSLSRERTFFKASDAKDSRFEVEVQLESSVLPAPSI